MAPEKMNVDPNNIAAIYFDGEKSAQYIFTRDQVVNQLQQVCAEIQKSFDDVFSKEFNELSSDISEILPLQFVDYKNAKENNNDLLIVCGDLLRNSANTIVAATQTLRSGFRLQSGILLRSVVEMCATVVHLLVKPGDLRKFLADELKSTKSVSIADKQIPLFGMVWGILSNKQIHINSLHADWYPMHKYNDKNEIPVTVTLGMLGISTMILAITTELTFINEIEKPKYWNIIKEGQVRFIPPSELDLEWISVLLNKK